MQPRGGAMTHADYKLWKAHDILGPTNCDADIRSRAVGFLWFCGENDEDGARNRRKLGRLQKMEIFRTPSTSRCVSTYRPGASSLANSKTRGRLLA